MNKRTLPKPKRELFRRHAVGGLITLGVLALLLGRWLWVTPSRPAHLQEIVAEFGAIGYLSGHAQPNQDGTQFTYVQTTEKGYGIFLQNLKSGQRKVMHEETEIDSDGKIYQTWPWSPDGKAFVFTRQSWGFLLPTLESQKMMVFQADADAAPAEVDIGSNYVASLAWLNSSSFVYANREGALKLVQRQADGVWKPMGTIATNVGTTELTALDENNLAWNRDYKVWVYDLKSKTTTRIAASLDKPIINFSYSKATRKFLLNGQDGSLWQFALDANTGADLALLATLPKAKRAAWINGGAGYICLIPQTNDLTLIIKPDIAAKAVNLFSQGFVDDFAVSPDGQSIFITGAVSNELAAGIWQYGIDTGGLACVVPCTDIPVNYSRRVDPQEAYTAGHELTYHLYSPARFDPKRKYPLLLIYSHYTGREPSGFCAEQVANGGAYVAIIERALFDQTTDWEGGILKIYQRLLQDLPIDTRRVFVAGISMETFRFMPEMLAHHPELCRGMIALNGYPQLPESPTGAQTHPRILVSIEDPHGGMERILDKYQASAFKSGLIVDYFIIKNAKHAYVCKQTLRDNSRAVMNFIFKN